VLLLAAHRLPEGRAVGADIWRRRDQSGNSRAAAEHNAVVEGVRDRVDVVNADARDLPFRSASFDVVVSSLTIHNIPGSLIDPLTCVGASSFDRPAGLVVGGTAWSTGTADDVRGSLRDPFWGGPNPLSPGVLDVSSDPTLIDIYTVTRADLSVGSWNGS